MVACGACTFENAVGATTCEMCGSSLQTESVCAPSGRVCATCTLENDASAPACVVCGSWWCERCTKCVLASSATCDACGYPDDPIADVEDEPDEPEPADATLPSDASPRARSVDGVPHEETR